MVQSSNIPRKFDFPISIDLNSICVMGVCSNVLCFIPSGRNLGAAGGGSGKGVRDDTLHTHDTTSTFDTVIWRILCTRDR